MGRKYFDKNGVMADLMVRMLNPSWATCKVVFMDSGFCVLEWLILMVEIAYFDQS